MVERFNGRVGSEVIGITNHTHAQLERLLRGFNAAYNARRQRVLDGKTPDQVVAERLKARRKLANPKPHGRAGPAEIAAARRIAEAAKDVSPPDTNSRRTTSFAYHVVWHWRRALMRRSQKASVPWRRMKLIAAGWTPSARILPG